MFLAIRAGNVHDVIALLDDNEVDINCKNINGQTPLHVSFFNLSESEQLKTNQSKAGLISILEGVTPSLELHEQILTIFVVLIVRCTSREPDHHRNLASLPGTAQHR